MSRLGHLSGSGFSFPFLAFASLAEKQYKKVTQKWKNDLVKTHGTTYWAALLLNSEQFSEYCTHTCGSSHYLFSLLFLSTLIWWYKVSFQDGSQFETFPFSDSWNSHLRFSFEAKLWDWKHHSESLPYSTFIVSHFAFRLKENRVSHRYQSISSLLSICGYFTFLLFLFSIALVSPFCLKVL